MAIGYGLWLWLKPAESDYEAAKLGEMPDWLGFWSGFLDFPGVRQMIGIMRRKLFVLPLVGGLTVGVLAYRKEWVMMAFSVCAFLGYFLVAALVYHAGESEMIMENVLAPLGLIVSAVAMVTAFRGLLHRHWLVVPLVVLAFLFGLRLEGQKALFRYKLEVQEQFFRYAHRIGESKLVVETKCFPVDRYKIPWAIAPEAMLLSALNSPDSVMLVYQTEDPARVMALPDQEAHFLYAPFWEYRPLSALPARYFNFPHQGYHYLNAAAGALDSLLVCDPVAGLSEELREGGPITGGDRK